MTTFINREITVVQLYQNFGTEFFRLTNETENHNGFQYKTGINRDTVEFNPSGECKAGGLYFFSKEQLKYCYIYASNVKFVRKVNFNFNFGDCGNGNARIYVEGGKFKADIFCLEERTEFYIDDFFDPIEVANHYAKYVSARWVLQHVKVQTPELINSLRLRY